MKIINETIGSYMNRVFDKFKNEEALVSVEDGRRFTYKKLNYQVNMIAQSLISIGVKKGDHVALAACNSPEWIISFLAILKIGAVAVCLNYSATEEELDYMLQQSDSTVLIVSDKDMIEKVDLENFAYLKSILKMKTLFNLGFIMAQMNQVSTDKLISITNTVSPEDVATILYTSGTTGKPKGVMTSHRSILNGALSAVENWHYTSKDKILTTLPFNHVLGGTYTALLSLLAGSAIILIKKFKTNLALQAIETEKCTGFHGVPTMYQYLLNKCNSYDLSSLRVGIIAGAIASETLLKNIMEHLHITELNNFFGQTEILGITKTTIYDKNHPKLTTVGKPIENVIIKICDLNTGDTLPPNTDGELCVKSPYCMLRYYNNRKATHDTVKDNWIHTGDIAFIDEDGYLSIKGRLDDVIIRGGENISPIDIETHLIKHSKIENAIAVGVPDETFGEEIYAFIKLKKSSTSISTLTKEDILNFLSGKMAKFKFPKYIEFIDSFPLTANGKIKRNSLKQIALERINPIVSSEIAIN